MSISSCNRRRHAIIPNKRNYHYRLSLNNFDHLIAHLDCRYIKQQRTEHKTSLMYILCWQQQITDYNILGIHYIRTERNKENPNKNGFCNMLSKSHFWLHLDSLFIIITLKLYYHKEWSNHFKNSRLMKDILHINSILYIKQSYLSKDRILKNHTSQNNGTRMNRRITRNLFLTIVLKYT